MLLFRTLLPFCSILVRDFSCTLWGKYKNPWNMTRLCWDKAAPDFFLCNVVPRVLREHCTEFFHVQYCLEALKQHCTRCLPAQYCPKSIMTILKGIFSCAVLSGASMRKKTYDNVVSTMLEWRCIWIFSSQCWTNKSETTLHKRMTCAMLVQGVQTCLGRKAGCSFSMFGSLFFNWAQYH